MLSENLESVQVIVAKKQKKEKKNPAANKPTKKHNEVTEDAIPRITLLDAVNLVVEIKGADYFNEVFKSIFKNDVKYKNYWDRFIFSINSSTNDVTPSQLKSIFCLLIYISDKSLPLYGYSSSTRIYIPSLYLLSISSWRDNFNEVKTDFKNYQKVTVEVKDIMYLF